MTKDGTIKNRRVRAKPSKGTSQGVNGWPKVGRYKAGRADDHLQDQETSLFGCFQQRRQFFGLDEVGSQKVCANQKDSYRCRLKGFANFDPPRIARLNASIVPYICN